LNKHFTFSNEDVTVEAQREEMPVEEAEEGTKGGAKEEEKEREETVAQPESEGQTRPEVDVKAELQGWGWCCRCERGRGGAGLVSRGGDRVCGGDREGDRQGRRGGGPSDGST
jgi:hypothetical protein